MPELPTISKCTGCSACYNACAKGAIKMLPDEEGFLHPVISSDLCVGCGLCEKACPEIAKSENCNYSKPTCYAMWHNEDRTKSSSGGAFSALARRVISQGGVVYGAAFDKELNLSHIGVTDIEGLDKLRGSKYVQSFVGNSYSSIRKQLKEGVKVLFCGTPCQVAGLKSYLGKDYDDLLTVDLACHGVPSEAVFKKF